MAGEQHCNSDILEICLADRSAIEMKKCEFGCDPERRACRPCAPVGKSCMSATELRSCDGDGVKMAACPSGCNLSRNECNVCIPNQRLCKGADLEFCNEAGTSSTTMTCSSGCSNNECNDCVVGSTWCNGASLFHCPMAKPVEKEKCPYGCSGGQCAICAMGMKVCEDDSILSACNDGGTAYTRMACSEGCNRTRNECNVCRPGAKLCKSDGFLEECRADGTGWIRSKCESGCLDTSACRVCEPGRKECRKDGQRWTCNGNGSAWEMTDCGGAGCNQDRFECNLCKPNAKSCAGKVLRTCNAQGTAYADLTCADPTPDIDDTEARGVGMCDSAKTACSVSCTQPTDYLRCPVKGQAAGYVCRQVGKPGYCSCFHCPGWADLCQTDLCATQARDPDALPDAPDPVLYKVTCDTQKGELKIDGKKVDPNNQAHVRLKAQYPCSVEDQ